MPYRFLVIPIIIFLVGCTHTPLAPQQRTNNANNLAAAENWVKQTLPSTPLGLVAYIPKKRQRARELTIYIEGDGLAWLTKSLVSPDPTPQNPVGLKLALKHPNGVAVYLARPCQYILDKTTPGCNNTHWTNGRFSAAVIASSQDAINILKQQFGAKEIRLVGYSGGGAVAALIAAQRDDVASLITVAGNLDHAKWSHEHRITPLKGSLNPVDYWQSLQDIPQVHFVGDMDDIVGKEIAESYASHFPVRKKPNIQIIERFDHSCCWSQQWPELMSRAKSILFP